VIPYKEVVLDVLSCRQFERKILRRIICPVNENGWWQRRYNKELYSIYKEPMVTDIVRSARLRWAGQVVRMNENEPPKKIITSNPGGGGGGQEGGAVQSSDG
jgi:hypothetical protein